MTKKYCEKCNSRLSEQELLSQGGYRCNNCGHKKVQPQLNKWSKDGK